MIQIYEVQRPKEAEALALSGVDHIGSVIVDSAKWKNATIRKTIQVIGQSEAKSGLILLFKDPVKIFQAIDYYQPDFVHFCEALSPFPGDQATVVREYDALLTLQIDIKDRFPQVDIMRSLSIPRPGMLDADKVQKNILHFVELLSPVSDFFLIDTLLDAASQPVIGYVGITGQTCDWKIAQTVIDASPIPVILAGGLAADNVYDAITRLKPAGVDSCTRTNALDRKGYPIRFKKDMEKVKKLVEEARRADEFCARER